MRGPSGKQRAALMFLNDDPGLDVSRLADMCQVQGGYGNEAEFILRLIDRGWVTLALTAEGKAVLDA